MAHQWDAAREEITTEEEGASSKVATLPNAITLARLCLVPVFAWAFLTGTRDALALGLLFVLGSTDWVDGFVARKTGQISEVGKLLDPVADRIAIVVILLAFTFRGTVYWPLAAAILGRDLIVAVAFGVLESKGYPRIPVNFIGKAATAAIYVGMGIAVMSLVPFFRAEEQLKVVSTLFLSIGAVLYWAAAGMYARDLIRMDRPAP